jgi:transcriptional regulator with XRE-family HTH domain
LSNPTPHPVDLHVGSRIRLRRKMAGVSQSQLGEALGLTFQQLQKYERGSNRISASKLHAVAVYLQTPIAWFFEGLADPATDDEAGQRLADMHGFLSSPEGAELAVALPRLPPRQRRQVLALVKSLAGLDDLAQSA